MGSDVGDLKGFIHREPRQRHEGTNTLSSKELIMSTKLFRILSCPLFATLLWHPSVFAQPFEWAWTSTYSTSGGVLARDIFVDDRGFVYVTGRTGGPLGGTFGGRQDVFLSKLDPAGNRLWTRQWGGSTVDEAGSIAVAPNGDIVIGASQGYTPILLRYDSSGALLSSTKLLLGGFVGVDGMGNVVIAGDTEESLSGPNAGGSDRYVTKINDEGNTLWADQFGLEVSDFPGEIAIDQTGNVYVVGTSRGAAPWNLLVSKHSPDGQLLWDHEITSSIYEYPRGVTVDEQGSSYFLGNNRLVKYSPTGEIQWNKLLGHTDPEPEEADTVSLDGDGTVYVVGRNFIDTYSPEDGTLLSNTPISQSAPEFGQGVFEGVADRWGNVYVVGRHGDVGFVSRYSGPNRVPEPSAAVLAILCACGLGWRGRRRRRRAPKQSDQCQLSYEPLESRALLSATELTIGTPELLLGAVNTPDRERSPSISGDGLSLYFQRSESFALNGNSGEQVDTELMVSTRSSTSDPWGPAVPLGAPISIGDHPETWPEISADGETLYFSDTSDPPAAHDPRPGGQGLGDLWVTTKDGPNQWQTPINLGAINSSSRDAAPELSADGLTLFFTSNRPGGSGEADLWMVERASESDPWQTPENLGPAINTQYIDAHPAISPDGLALAFSSNRSAEGADSFDIWIATRPSLNDPFSDPISLRGQLPDGFYGTHSPEFSADGSTLYFDSRGSSLSNSFDLWEVSIDVNEVVFEDSFEDGQWNGKWVVDGQADWNTSTQRASLGDASAEVDGRANDAALTMATPVDLSGYERASLRFDWLIESSFDSGEYIAVDVSSDGGATWQEVSRLRGNVDAENRWHAESIEISELSSNVLVRFRGKANRSNEDANVDNVRIVAGGTAAPQPPQAPTIASLTAAPSPVIQGDDLTLTASGVSDADGAVSSVAFYRDANGNGQLDLGADDFLGNDANGGDGWSVAASTAALALGSHSYFAQATDDDGLTSNVASTVSEVIDQPTGSVEDIYVSFIDMTTRNRGRNLDGRVIVNIMNDANGDGSVTGDVGAANVWVEATVTGPGGFTQQVSGYTNSSGEFRSNWLRGIADGQYTVEVVDLVHGTFDWNMALNLEDDSNGDGWPDEMFTLS